MLIQLNGTICQRTDTVDRRQRIACSLFLFLFFCLPLSQAVRPKKNSPLMGMAWDDLLVQNVGGLISRCSILCTENKACNPHLESLPELLLGERPRFPVPDLICNQRTQKGHTRTRKHRTTTRAREKELCGKAPTVLLRTLSTKFVIYT